MSMVSLGDVLCQVPGLLAGVTRVPGVAQGGPPLEEARELPWALALAVPLSAPVIEGLVDRPTPLYKHHYGQVNDLLDRLALQAALTLQAAGARALPLPASLIVDWSRPRGHLDHRRVALAAGLGRLGRHGLLVTPEHGARVRLVTVLCDREPALPEAFHRPAGACADCGSCRACLGACPAGAVKELAANLDVEACGRVCADFSKRLVGVRICGLCLRACGPVSRA